MRKFYHSCKFYTLAIDFSEGYPRQILDLGKQFNLMISLENILKTSLPDVLKISWIRFEGVFKTSWRHLEDVLKTFLQDVLKTFWRRLEDTLKTLWRRLQDVLERLLEDVLKMYWKRLKNILKTHSQGRYIGLDQDVLKAPWRRLLKTYD